MISQPQNSGHVIEEVLRNMRQLRGAFSTFRMQCRLWSLQQECEAYERNSLLRARDYDPSQPSKLIRSMTIALCTQDVVPVGALQNDRSFTFLSRLFLAVLEVDNGDKEDVRVLAGKMLLMSVLRRTSPPGLVIYGRPPIAKGILI